MFQGRFAMPKEWQSQRAHMDNGRKEGGNMLNKIWAGMILISFFCAAVTGRMEALSQAVLEGSGKAVELTLSMAGMMCAWTGLLQIAEAGGITALLARVMSPVIGKLFPGCRREGEAMQAISLNITANLLGLGNAATPLGIAAMKALSRECSQEQQPSRAMIRFVVLNTASIQLIPTYIATLRAQYGSASPFDITPAVWVTSLLALMAALFMSWLLERGKSGG